MYEFDSDMVVNLRVFSSVSALIRAEIHVLYRDGRFGNTSVEVTSSGDYTTADFNTSPAFRRPGKVVGAFVYHPGSTVLEPGQIYAACRLGRAPATRNQPLCGGYVRAERQLGLGVFESPGPAGVPGNQTPFTVASDVAGNVDTSFSLLQANALRRYDGFILYYHCSGDVAARTMTVRIRDLGLGVPTGFDAGSDRQIMAFAGPALSANEDGILYMNRGHYTVAVDDNVITTSNNTTAPNPFPFWVHEGEATSNLLVDVSAGEALDTYSAYLFGEEWLVP